ncbi:MAG TPA: hypothetical protein VKT00_08340 [Casimicrobiaceae bacterium]|nr:hypothetical protein [Casimicrobiaceae bacterium]
MRLSRAALEDIEAAGAEIVECMRALDRGGIDLVSEVLRGHGTFYELDHYPPDDVFDSARHSQYYYHAHRPGEHGHFHTFVRGPGMPPGATPVPRAGDEPWPAGDDAIAHLVAISMDAHGRPLALFTVNRWVTGEAWYPATSVVRMLDAFRIDHASPSWPLNRWLTAMLRFYRPEIAWLLHRRDEAVADRARHHPGVDVLEDRGLEVTSELPIDIARHLTDIRRALRQSNP